MIDNRAVRSQLSPLLSPLSTAIVFPLCPLCFQFPTSRVHLTLNFHRCRASPHIRSVALKNVTNRRREGQKAAVRPRGKPGVSTANGARLISWAIHLNDRAKASSSFHTRVYTQRRYRAACQQRVCSHTYCRSRATAGSGNVSTAQKHNAAVCYCRHGHGNDTWSLSPVAMYRNTVRSSGERNPVN